MDDDHDYDWRWPVALKLTYFGEQNGTRAVVTLVYYSPWMD